MTKPKNRRPRDWGMRLTSGLMAAAMSFSLLTPTLSFALEQERETEEQDPLVIVETLGEIETTEGESHEFNVGESSIPEIPLISNASHWADPYTEKMVEYGYMRAQDASEPDAEMSRAEFAAVINRAYNYTESSGTMAFEDVSTQDWFYDDIDIATTAGFITGTSPTTVEPNGLLTRETTAFILGKNLMLPTVFGEDLSFTDTRDISSWSRALVKATSEYGLMAGYTDGSFRPLSNITRGEISALVMKAIGTPILESGETSLGEVYGNVTITESGTILKNTVIAGDLHISNGIGLGSVMLENVTVLGRIVVSGGESQDGDASILLRNVVAEELVIDNMDDQFVSVRVDGNSYIENTNVRTNAYVEDTTTTTNGLINIKMDAEPGITLDLAGRVKNVTNTSPGTIIRVVDGTVDVMNIDETATEVVTEVLNGAQIIQLNIDVATNVTGDGDIKNVVVNADDVVIEMLPDNIEIRPGVNANIDGVDMDNLTAEEYSDEPKILSGYPTASDIAPTGLDAVFATNKTGTVYWAVSNISQGSVAEADLIKPPSYGNIALQYGAIDITEAEEEFMAPITDLPIGGNYYLAAVLVDTRGDHSPVKVISFTTPDDSVPAFAEGYPYMSEVGNTSGQVTVMSTKDCKLYYAVLPSGAIAPTATDFLANSVSGNFGYGSQTLTKNKSESYTVSDILNELTTYDLYLWLTDADGMNSSEVYLLSFTTTDGTPPIFNQDVQTTTIGTTDVDFAFNINEKGTLYWAVVDTGTYYPSVKPGDTTGNLSEPLTSEYAAYSVMWGIGAMFAGSVDTPGNTTTDFKLTGLGLESSYDMYYVARDEAGNFSTPVQMLTFNTIDNTPPSFVEQLFTHVANSNTADDPDYVPQPYASTSVSIVFSEGIQATNSGQSFMQLYNNVLSSSGDDLIAAKNTLGSTLEYCFPFYIWSGNSPADATIRNADNEGTIGNDWVIDYRNATITMLDGKMAINFVTITDDVNGTSALNLSAGLTYGFKIQNIRDASSDANIMVPAELIAGQNSLGFEKFTTVYAQILLGNADVMVGNLPYARDADGIAYPNSFAVVDADLQVTPSDMGNVDDKVVFEMRMEPDAWVSYNLYMRIVDPKGVHTDDMLKYYPDTPTLDYFTGADAEERKIKVENNFVPDSNGWIYLNMDDVEKTADTSMAEIQGTATSNMGVGLINSFWGYQEDTMPYPFLFELSDEYQYEFVFEVTKFDSTTTRGEWNGFLNIELAMWAGSYSNAKSIGAHSDMTTSMKNAMSLVSSPEGYTAEIIFTDSIPPEFNTGAPVVYAEDIFAELKMALTRQGEVNYVIVKSDYPTNLGPKDEDGDVIIDVDGTNIPYINHTYWSTDTSWPNPDWPTLSAPTGSDLLKQVSDPGDGVIAGVVSTGINTISIPLEDLDPLSNYYIYFLTKSDSGGGYSDVMVGQFFTLETERPIYKDMKPTTNADVTYATHVDSELTYLFLTYTALQLHMEYLLSDMNTVIASAGTSDEKQLWMLSSYYTENLTILDCMTRMFDANLNSLTANGWSSSYTVFDVYTPASVKNYVYELIEGGVSNHAGQELNLPADKDVKTLYERTDANANPDMEYVYLVAGRNVNAPTSGTDGDAASTRSFRALTNMRVSDTEFPRITNITTTISTMDSSYYDGTRFSGTIAITFDKTVYALRTSTSTVYPINVKDGDNFTDALYLEDIVSTIPAPSGANNRISLSKEQSSNLVYVFEFENFQKGEYIYLFNGYNISNADGVARTTTDGGNPLQVTFNVGEETITETSSTIKFSKDLFWSTNWEVDGYSSNSVEISKTERITSTVPTELAITSENGITTTKIGGEIQLTVTPVDGIIDTPGNISWTFASGSTLGTLTGSEDKATFKATSSGDVVIRVTYSGVSTTFALTVEAPTVTLTAPTDVAAGSFNTISVTIGNVESTANTSGIWSITGGGALYESQSNDKPEISVERSFGTTGTILQAEISFKAATSGGGSISFTYGGVKATEDYNFTQSAAENNGG